MLKKYYIENIHGKYDLNCSESVLQTANEVYGMNLSHEALRLSSPFGGGMFIEEKCGAVTASLMVLGYFFVETRAHSTEILREIVNDYFDTFKRIMGTCECSDLKIKHRSEDYGCRDVITAALDVLDIILKNYSKNRVR